MGQFREYTESIFISDDQVTITATIRGSQYAAVVARDASMDTNFKAAIAAHLDIALAAPPTATSPPCTVMTQGKWSKVLANASITSASTIIMVPTGNSGNLILRRDDGAFTMKYSKNGGAATTYTDGVVITVVDGDTLAFSATGIPEQEFATGSVTDGDTEVSLDIISLYNSTPVP